MLATQQSPLKHYIYTSSIFQFNYKQRHLFFNLLHSCIEISYINKYYNASSFLRNIKYSISMSSLLTFCHALQLQKDILKTFSKLSSSKTVYKATVLRIKKAKSPR